MDKKWMINKNTTKATHGGQSSSYLEQRRAQKLKGGGSQDKKDKVEKKKEVKVFYANQALIAPANCENCGNPLQPTKDFHSRAHICHILFKDKISGCPSVSTHPQNRWFGCMDCHTIYDNALLNGNFYTVEAMKIFPVLVERMKLVYPEIKQTELRRVPIILQPKSE